MDVLHSLRVELNPVLVDVCVEAFVAPLDSKDVSDLIVIPEAHDQLTNDYIEAGAKTSTSHDTDLGLAGVSEEVLSRASFEELDAIVDVIVRFIE